MTVALIVCAVVTVVGILTCVVSARRHRTGRAVQAVGLAVLPAAIYLTGLLRLVVAAVAGVLHWLGQLIWNPIVWSGFGLLAVSVALWWLGGRTARRQRDTALLSGGTRRGRSRRRGPDPLAAPGLAGSTRSDRTPAAGPADPEMAEVEALLKARGIR